MKKNYLYTLLFVFFFSILSFGQEDKKIQQADKKFKKYAFIDAQKILLKVAEEGYRSKDLFQKLGDSYYYNADYVSANKWYSELIKSYENDGVPAEYYFRYAQSLKSSEKYDDSDKMMDKFRAIKGSDLRAQNYEEEPDYLKQIDFQSGRYKVENLKANSSNSDFGPSYYGEKLVFASSRDTGLVAKRVHQWNDQPFLELYGGEIIENSGQITSVKGFSNKLNTKFHESTPVFTNDLKTVYFTRNNYNNGEYKQDSVGTNRLKIYKSTLKDNGYWSAAEPIRFNNDEYSVGHPALSPDNTKLYFSSDMPGGAGQSDIYVAAIAADGSLGEAKNLGTAINTEGKDTFPFMSKNGNLYFSSTGHIGLGGLDVYVATIDESDNVSSVINLGEPINTPQDDFAFIVNDEEKTGYFSSNRPGGKGDDDIYKFVQLEDVKEPCEIVLTGIVSDKDTGALLPESQVTLLDSNNEVVKTMTVGPKANYSFIADCSSNYFLRAEKEDYSTTEELVNTPAVSETVDTPLQLEKTIKVAEIGKDLGKILNLNPIYFDFDKYNIRYDASVELAKVIAVMKEYPTMKIDVRSHTDSRANDTYNDVLSSNRNKSTIAYIIEKGGIDPSRLTGRGYGERQLVNKCANGIPCSEADHQLNRRSEFIILEY